MTQQQLGRLHFDGRFLQGFSRRTLALSAVLSIIFMLTTFSLGFRGVGVAFVSFLISLLPALVFLFCLRVLPQLKISSLWLYIAIVLFSSIGGLAAARIHLMWGEPSLNLVLAPSGVWGIFATYALWVGASNVWIARLKQIRNLERHEKEEKLRMEKSVLTAELKALQAQIEPHFLFNTLANVQALIDVDSVQAKLMLERLVTYLRASLPKFEHQWSSVSQELELADHYLALIKFRFGERFSYSIEADERVSNEPMPPLMLLTLIENAVKHGVEPKRGVVSISVSIRSSKSELICEVMDNGVGLTQKTHTDGVGITNIKERLSRMYGAPASVSLHERAGGGVSATLRLPLNWDA